MSIPAWIREIFGVVILLAAEVSIGQLVVARAWIRRGGADADIAVSQLLMGIAMAGVLVPGLSILPNAAWEVVFAVMTAWFVWCLWRESRGRGAAAVARGHYAPHLVQSAAMIYMFAALAGPSVEGSGTSVSSPGGMPGMPGMAGGSSTGVPTPHVPVLALIFALLLVAFTIHDLDRQAGVDGVDGYFRVVSRRFVPGRSALAAAATWPVAPRADPAAYTAERLLLSPAVVKGCQVATGVTMAFILITMI
jgi:Domain of unknown function (DUF5134)